MDKKYIRFEDLPSAVAELLNKLENFESAIDALPKQIPVNESSPYLYGLKELAEFLNVSTVTAQRIKNSGRIPFSQAERTIIFKKEDVIKALSNNYKFKK